MKKSNKFFTKLSTVVVSLAMALGVGVAAASNMGVAKVSAAGQTLTFTKLGDEMSTTSGDGTIVIKGSDSNNYTFNYGGAKQTGSKSPYAVLLAKGADGGTSFFSNKTAMPGDITSIKVYINSGASGSATYHCAFKTTECTSKYTTGSSAINITGGNNNTYTCNVDNARYFCISLGANYNGQLLKIDVNYDDGAAPSSYSVTYDGNGATSGSVPTDATEYSAEGTDNATVLGNTGNLARTSYSFVGWNTKADGTGTDYAAGSSLPVNGNIVLYAKWNYTKYTDADGKITWDLGKESYDSASASAMAWSSGGKVTMGIAKGTAGTDTNNYCPPSQTSTRLYKNSILTIAPCDGYKVSSIVITATTDGYATALKNSAWTNATASTNNSVVTITPVTKSDAVSAIMSATTGFSSAVVSYSSTAALASIALSGTYQTTFANGEAFNHDGMIVTATYSDSDTAVVTEEATWSGYDTSATGNQTVTVSYTENEITKTAEYEITVEAPKEVVAWDVTGSAAPTVVGKNYDLTGLTLHAYYDNGKTDEASAGVAALYEMVANPAKAGLTPDENNKITIEVYAKEDTEHNTLLASIGEVLAPIKEPDKGSEDRPYTIEEALAVTAALANNASTPEPVYVTGFVSALTDQTYNSQYGNKNFYMTDTGEDSEANELYIYRAYYVDAETKMTEEQFNSIGLGDRITMCGKLKKYVNNNVTTLEMDANGFVYHHDQETRAISISNDAETLLYNDTFSYGGTVSTAFTLRENADVTAQATFTGYDMTKVDEPQTVTVHYVDDRFGELTKTYTLTVQYADVASVALNHTSSSMAIDKTLQLTATLNEHTDPATVVSWTSDHPEIATVSDSGLVTSKSAGTATITARVSETIYATCVITVTANPVVTLDHSTVTGVYSGQSGTLVASADNFAGTVEYQWSSSNTEIATVTKDTANPNTASVAYVSGGEVEITVSASDGANTKTATCTYTITQSTATLDDITSSAGDKLYLGSNKTSLTLTTKATAVGTATDVVTWDTSDDNIATVDKGVVTANAAGDATITAKSSTNDEKTIVIHVLAPTTLEVDTSKAKTTYRLGDKFSNEGLDVKAVYSDQTKLDAYTYSVSTPDLTTSGKKEVEVTSFGAKATYEINVLEDQYYTRIQYASDLKAGDKLLLASPVAEGELDIADLTLPTSGTRYFPSVTVSITDDGIKQTDAIEANELILGGQEGAWTLSNAAGKLLVGGSTNATKLAWVDATDEIPTAATWKISLNNDESFTIENNDSEVGYLRYNEASPRFSTYKQSTNPFLYKVGAKTPADVLAEKKAEAIAAIDTYVATLKEADYSQNGWAQITRLVSAAKEQVNVCTKVEDIDPIVAQLKADVAAVKTAAQEAAEALANAKTAAKAELEKYYNAIDQAEYTATGKQALKDAYDNGVAAIEAATTEDAVTSALASAKQALAAVEKSEVVGIEVTTNPTKTTYNIGDEANYAGIVVTIKYNDQSTDTVGVDALTFEGFDSTTAGEKTITVKYGDKSTTFKITVSEAPAEDVDGAKAAAIEELRQYMLSLLDSGEYDTTGRQQLGQEYDKGIVLINSATTIAEVDTALVNAKALLDAVQKTQPVDDLATAKANAIADIEAYVAAKGESNYSAENWATIQTLLEAARTSINDCTTIEDVRTTLNGAKAFIDLAKTIDQEAEEAAAAALAEAKANAINELDTFVNNLNRADYSDEAWAQIQSALQEAKTAINNATDASALNTLVAQVKATINAVKDNLELAKEAAIAALDVYYNSFDKDNYDEAGLSALRAALDNGKVNIEAATTTEGVAAALTNAKADMDKVETKSSAPAVKRCGGDIAATSIILSAIALAGVGLLVFKKRKQD